MSDPTERLASIFEKFPGIGSRQAGRFVQYLLRSSSSARRELSDAIRELGTSVRQCPECMRYHAGEKKVCSICGNPERDASELAIVATDTDLAALEKSGTYRGRYFVLGGTISLGSEGLNGLRVRELEHGLPVRQKSGLKEVILAFPANPEGDATAEVLREALSKFEGFAVTSLGRGLSTGSELEYADPETIKNAFESRK